MVSISTIIHVSYSCVAVCFIPVSNELRKEFEGRRIYLVHDSESSAHCCPAPHSGPRPLWWWQECVVKDLNDSYSKWPIIVWETDVFEETEAGIPPQMRPALPWELGMSQGEAVGSLPAPPWVLCSMPTPPHHIRPNPLKPKRILPPCLHKLPQSHSIPN